MFDLKIFVFFEIIIETIYLIFALTDPNLSILPV